jgi:type II secretory pathway component PulK
MKLTSAEYSKVFHLVTAAPMGGGGGVAAASTTAKINVNTASSAVLACLPSLTQADADAIAAHRQQNPTPADPADISWMLDVIGERSKRLAIADAITGTSCCFSGDIVAVTNDGRTFKRVRVVIDGSSGTSKIIYRRDTTSAGWPLAADVRAQLRGGQQVSPSGAGSSSLLPGKGGTAQ